MAAKRRGQPPRARAAVVPLPRAQTRAPKAARRFLPSARSLALGFGILALAGGAYAVARQTSVFAVDTIEVAGAPAPVAAQVKRVLAPLVGTSLLSLDGAALRRHVEALPTVVSVVDDRAFPHTLRVTVVPESPVAVLRRGRETWLVSARGRVVQRVPARTYPGLARIWVPAKTALAPGGFLADETGGIAARALAVAAAYPVRIAVATAGHGQLVFKLRSGLELRLGDPTDVRLKLAIARRALAALPSGATYLDVSVPGRPVAGGATAANPQLSGIG